MGDWDEIALALLAMKDEGKSREARQTMRGCPRWPLDLLDPAARTRLCLVEARLTKQS